MPTDTTKRRVGLLVTRCFFRLQGLANKQTIQSNANAEPYLELIVLGDSAAFGDGNLSAFFTAFLARSLNYIALDAGTVVRALIHSIQYGAFDLIFALSAGLINGA